jgi:hypothetical protein
MIKITKTEIICEYTNEEGVTEIHNPIENECLNHHLTDDILLEEGITIAHILENMKPFFGQLNFLFAYCLNYQELFQYYNEMLLPYDNSNDRKNDYLEIGRTAELLYIDEEANEINEYVEFYGIAVSSDEETEAEFSVELLPLYKMRDMPIKINERYDLVKYSDTGNIIKGADGIEYPELKQEDVVETYKIYTLRDFLECIFSEITKHGSVEDKKELLEEVQKIQDESPKDQKYQILQLENELEKALSEEDYVQCAKLRDEIEILKASIKRTNNGTTQHH